MPARRVTTPPAALTRLFCPGTLIDLRPRLKPGFQNDGRCLENVQAAGFSSLGTIRSRDGQPQHDQPGLCCGGGRRRRDGAANDRSGLRAGASRHCRRALALSDLLRLRMGRAASRDRSGRTRAVLSEVGPWRRGRGRRDRGAGGASTRCRTEDGLATCGTMDRQGGARGPRLAPAAARSGAGIGVAPERAGDLPDRAVPRVGRRLLLRARCSAGDIRQCTCRPLVGRGHVDDHRLWRRGADHATRTDRRCAGDDFGPWRIRAVDRHPCHRFCRRDPARQFPEDLGIREQRAVLRQSRPVGDRRRDAHAAHHRSSAAHDHHPQGPAGRLHVFHRLRRGRGRSARQEGQPRRRRVLRRDGITRQQSALGKHRHDEAVEAAGAGPRRFPPVDGAPSGSRRDASIPRPGAASWRTNDANATNDRRHRSGKHARPRHRRRTRYDPSQPAAASEPAAAR